ncbi:MAG: ribosome recycling factor, partial [Anaerolineaceae bacterium]|nr:ribosome recycling factor [Anaerolineaceae bacterium]
RIACRNVRRDIIKDLKEYEKEKLITEDDLKRAEEELQKVIEYFNAEIDRVGERKTIEIMEV